MIPNLKLYLIIAAYVSSIGGSVYLTAKYKDGQYAVKEQKILSEHIVELQKRQEEYDAKVRGLNKKALERQAELANLNSELERKYYVATKRANQAFAKYNNLIANGWRLRDPDSPTNPSTEVSGTSYGDDSPTTNSGDGTSSGRELSRETTKFLLQFANDADKVVEQLKISQEYALRLKQICEQQYQ